MQKCFNSSQLTIVSTFPRNDRGHLFLYQGREGYIFFLLLKPYLSFGKSCPNQFISIVRSIQTNIGQDSLCSDEIYLRG